jgi:hypothetical protein
MYVTVHARDGMPVPAFWEDRTMKASLRFAASLTVAISSISLPCGLIGTALSQTTTPTGASTSLPNIVVEAPKHVARPQKSEHRTVARSAVSGPTSVATRTPSAASDSISAKLAKLASATGSCVGGCQSSFKSGNEPWHGCSVSSGSYLQSCRNIGNYKSYDECYDAGLTTGWRVNEASVYCTVLAINGAFGKRD